MIKKMVFTILPLILFNAQQVSAEFILSDRTKIYYTDSKSKGQVVVLLHGFSMSSSMWHETGIVDRLSEKHRVITLDIRGHGKSGKPEGVEHYGPKVAEDVINLLNSLRIEKAHLVGYSMGAYIVGRILVTNPKKVATATLVSGFFPSDDSHELQYQESVAKDMEEHGEQVLADVARGWRYDAVTDKQIAQIKVPMQAIFGSEEIDQHFQRQVKRLELPESFFKTMIIEGADHDSKKAAVLHPNSILAVEKLVNLSQDEK